MDCRISKFIQVPRNRAVSQFFQTAAATTESLINFSSHLLLLSLNGRHRGFDFSTFDPVRGSLIVSRSLCATHQCCGLYSGTVRTTNSKGPLGKFLLISSDWNQEINYHIRVTWKWAPCDGDDVRMVMLGCAMISGQIKTEDTSFVGW